MTTINRILVAIADPSSHRQPVLAGILGGVG